MSVHVSPVLIKTVTTTDRYGNTTKTTEEFPLQPCLLEPQQTTERTDPRSPGVTVPAKLYIVGQSAKIDSDDKFRIDGKMWEIIGLSDWGDLEVAIKRWGNG